LDGTPTPWDNKSFAFLGDLVQNLISTIQFPDNAFEEIQVQVQTADYMLHHLDDLNISPVFIPVEPDAEDLAVQENRTRRFIYLPAVTILDPKVANLSGRIEGKSNCVLLTTV